MHFPVTVTLGEVPDGVSKLLLEQALMTSRHLPNLPLQSRADVRAAGFTLGRGSARASALFSRHEPRDLKTGLVYA